MKLFVVMTTVSCALVASMLGYAAAPANAPAGTTGLCKDGTYYSGATKKCACKGHKGVKEWYGAPEAAAAKAPAPVPAPTATPAAPVPPPVAAPEPKTAPAAAAPEPKAATPPAPKVAAAPGGGAGKVWVNKSTRVYHCPGDRWYGKTKEGEYMSEADAKAQGFKADHDKACK